MNNPVGTFLYTEYGFVLLAAIILYLSLTVLHAIAFLIFLQHLFSSLKAEQCCRYPETHQRYHKIFMTQQLEDILVFINAGTWQICCIKSLIKVRQMTCWVFLDFATCSASRRRIFIRSETAPWFEGKNPFAILFFVHVIWMGDALWRRLNSSWLLWYSCCIATMGLGPLTALFGWAGSLPPSRLP